MCSAILDTVDTRCAITTIWSDAFTGTMAGEFVLTGVMAKAGGGTAGTRADIATVRLRAELRRGTLHQVMLPQATLPQVAHQAWCTDRRGLLLVLRALVPDAWLGGSALAPARLTAAAVDK